MGILTCYEIPGDITKEGKPIRGGVDINLKDFQFAAKVYPKKPAQDHAASPPAHPVADVPAHPTTYAVAESPDSDTLHIVIMDGFDPETGVPTDSKKPRFARIFATYTASGNYVRSLTYGAAQTDRTNSGTRQTARHAVTDASTNAS